MHVHIMKKEIKKIVGMRWSAFGRQHNVMKINIPLSMRRKVNNSTCFIIYGSNMFLLYMDQQPGVLRKPWNKNFKMSRGMEIIMFGITWREIEG